MRSINKGNFAYKNIIYAAGIDLNAESLEPLFRYKIDGYQLDSGDHYL